MPEGTRKILGAVLMGGKFYKAGQEDALAAILKKRPSAETRRLLTKEVITGDWNGVELEEPAPLSDDELAAIEAGKLVENGVEDDSVDNNDEAPATKRAAKKATKRARK